MATKNPAYSTNFGPTLDRSAIRREVADGLPNSRPRIACAIENQAYYDFDGQRYQPRREAEMEFDWAGRPKRESGLTQVVVDVLCEHQYSPGPSRTLAAEADKKAGDFLASVYETTHLDAVMHEAETLSTLNDVACIQIRCTNDDESPIDLQLWGSDEFTVFLDPNKPQCPLAVVTIDRVNEQTRYRLWWPDVLETYLTEEYTADRTSGGLLAKLVATEPNTYGCLPFCFVHYRDPMRRFWTPSVGTFARRGEKQSNDRLSRLAESLNKFINPIGVLKNVPPEFNPILTPGRFVRLYSAALGTFGDFSAGAEGASIEYLQAQIAVDAAWTDIREFVAVVFQAARVPLSAVRMEQQGFASGIALLVEQAPLLMRAKARRPLFIRAETCLTRTILTVAGNHYDRPELLAAAKALRLMLAWAEAEFPVPGPDRDAADEWELQQGILSRIELLKRRRGFSTDEQAIDYLKKVKKDNDLADKIDPPEPPPGMDADGKPVPAGETDQGDDGEGF